MKFIVSSSELLKQLQILNGIINSNNTLPILDNFLFEISDNELLVSASDLETFMSSRINIEGGDNCSIAIPSRILLDVMKTFPSQPLTFSIESGKNTVNIVSEQGRYTVAYHDGAEFPKQDTSDNNTKALLPSNLLSKAISKTIFATSNDDLRPIMTGVFLKVTESGFTCAATDSHKLVTYSIEGDLDVNSSDTQELIIPKKPASIIKNILSSNSGDVEVLFNERSASFSFGDTSLVCRLIDGKYPNYSVVIPKENDKKMIVNKSKFLNSVKRISIFANKTTHQIRLKVSGNELNISAEDNDFSNAANERLNCDYTGDDIEIGFNSRFLTEMLSNIDSDNIILELSSPSRAGILLPETYSQKGESILMLVMPVMLDN